jgi:hypothetical protein
MSEFKGIVSLKISSAIVWMGDEKPVEKRRDMMLKPIQKNC